MRSAWPSAVAVMMPSGDPRVRVLIAGGGVAALEALLALRALAGDRVAISLMSPEPELVYRPVTVAEAFGRAEAGTYQLADILADQHVSHIVDSLVRVDPVRHAAMTASNATIPYDALLVATGARTANPLPGALMFGGRAEVPQLRTMLGELVDGTAASVAFTLAREQTWALPLYELALMTASHLRDHGSDARVMIVTPEDEPLGLFGPPASAAVREMLSAVGIGLRCLALPAGVTHRQLLLAGGGGVPADRVVTLPALEGLRLAGLPADDHGFIPVDAHGRVAGAPDVYAAGDVTTFPFKQGGVAAQEADAAAEAIAQRAGASLEPAAFRPVLRGLLMTAGAPLYLRCEPHRLARQATVAIDVPSPSRSGPAAPSASDQPLWWPPVKVAGRYLAPYLSTARPVLGPPGLLADRMAVPGPALPESEHHDALELALLLAEGDARWGDYRSALAALEAAEALEGALPPEYETKRRMWQAEAAS
jgi:sulfide:quinone oxidoreductase